VIVEAAGNADCARSQIMAADDGDVARGAVASAVAATPYRPAWLIDRHRLLRSLEHRGIGKRNLRGRTVALGRKAERRPAGATDAAAAVDEGVEHKVEKLALHLEANLRRAGRGFAGKLV
jgi:hypothetical protein